LIWIVSLLLACVTSDMVEVLLHATWTVCFVVLFWTFVRIMS
jgi:hypothetical protein